MRNKTLAVLTVIGALSLPAAAFGAPSFGPGAGQGQGNNMPQDQGARCHPPGQTSDLPQCQ